MYKCNRCDAVFDSPAEQQREIEYYPRPFGNGSEPYGGGYYDCCPCCLEEDFEEYKEEIDELTEVKQQLALTEKALEQVCLSLRGKCDYCKYKDDEICPTNHHCSNLVMEYFLEQAKEMINE